MAVTTRRALRSGSDADKRKARERLKLTRQALDAALQAEDDAAHVHLGLAELALAGAMLDGDEAAGRTAIASLDDVKMRSPGRRLWRSALDNWEFILGVGPAAGHPAQAEALLAALRRLAG